MTAITTEQLQALATATRALLDAHPRGIGEHALIKALRHAHPALLPAAAPGDALALFRTHFLLFHVLYELRERLWAAAEAELVIDPLRIVLRPYAASPAALRERDPLRDYYRDLSRLDTVTAAEVEAMLRAFYHGRHDDRRRTEALAALGLPATADDAQITRRYRRLAMRHHPDRGGDNARLQAINNAMAALSRRGRR